MSFHVGQRVVCVDDRDLTEGVHPVKGSIYTIRALRWSEWFERQHVLLEEILKQSQLFADGFHEGSFRADRFRPVKTTSIEIFHQMLVTPPKETVDA